MSAANTPKKWIGIGLLGLPLHDYRFLKYLAIGRRTKPAFSYVSAHAVIDATAVKM